MADKKWHQEYYQRNKEKLKAKAGQWYEDNKESALTRLKVTNKEWAERNKKRMRELQYEYSQRWPWIKVYRRIITRVNSNHKAHAHYKKLGIKNFLTVTDLKMLWFRDKADKMKRPSIDRKESDKHYTVENCRFIELLDNISRANKGKKRVRS